MILSFYFVPTVKIHTGSASVAFMFDASTADNIHGQIRPLFSATKQMEP